MIAALAGRILLAIIFVVSGIAKLFALGGTETLLASAGLPPSLALPSALFEIIAGLAIALGFMTRIFAILLAGFCLLTALLFHRNLADPMQATMALKNIAMAGGLLCLFAHSQMRWSYDSMRIRREGDVATRDAEGRAREAELRAARAEGHAEGVKAAREGRVVAGDPGYVATNINGDVDGDGIPDRPRKWWQPG
jgi:putative oxidoreductase